MERDRLMKNIKRKVLCILMTVIVASQMVSCTKTISETSISGKNKQEFTPRLDTEKKVSLEMAGFMGNFEALDQVVNNFNEIYPNVTITYEHNDYYMLSEYIKNNQGLDIFMVKDENIYYPEVEVNNVLPYCLDLGAQDIDLSAINQEVLEAGRIDGALVRIPLALNPCGIVVNETLLQKEGLSVPKNYEEFIQTMQTLKERGYTPLQGSQGHLYAEISLNMLMNIIAEDDSLLTQLESGDNAAVEKVQPVFEKLNTIIDNGYTDYELNCTYPSDNYDAAILSFFKGDVPFWVCNAESFSGAKKRESKSEEYSKNPFNYEFMYAPYGDNGAYAYTEAWYGFAVNKDSDDVDYAVEFMRFLATGSQLNLMATIKGMPSVTMDGTDERYPALKSQDNIEAAYTDNGKIEKKIRSVYTQISTDFGAGMYKDAKVAAQAFVEAVAQ